jgi:hypothetical protein
LDSTQPATMVAGGKGDQREAYAVAVTASVAVIASPATRLNESVRRNPDLDSTQPATMVAGGKGDQREAYAIAVIASVTL